MSLRQLGRPRRKNGRREREPRPVTNTVGTVPVTNRLTQRSHSDSESLCFSRPQRIVGAPLQQVLPSWPVVGTTDSAAHDHWSGRRPAQRSTMKLARSRWSKYFMCASTALRYSAIAPAHHQRRPQHQQRLLCDTKLSVLQSEL